MTSSKKLQPNSAESSMNNSLNTEMRYEQALAELELIVSQMELGNLALDDSFKAYKRGAELIQICQTALNHVEQQVQILTGANKLAVFNPDDA